MGFTTKDGGFSPECAEVKARIGNGSKLRKLLELQEVLYKTVRDPDTKPLEQASCARAWEVLEERLRIIRGKPLPGHLQPSQEPKRKFRGRSITSITPESLAKSMEAAA